jgi:gliding motility-associated-like protein
MVFFRASTFIFYILCSFVYSQTVTIDTSVSVEELIETHLFDDCIEVSNVSSSVNGSINGLTSYGTFSKSTSNFPFDNGIVLSTGNANSAGNVVITEKLNDGDGNWGTDSDLQNELGINNTFNATSIEFDFISALVINAQKFFTPNNDTYFDTWNIIGIETLPGSIIYIFDRYGKLLTKLNHNSDGWDGTYRGYEMPATDYWFLAKIITPTEQFEHKGHFTLKR